MSPSSLSKSLPCLKMDQKEFSYEKQGIVSILSLGSEGKNPTTSLRRTLSADMSSRKWLQQNGVVFPMRKIASSEELPAFVEEKDDSSYPQGVQTDRLLTSIQEETMKKEKEIGNQNPERFDAWSSILTKKDSFKSSESLPSPYIHPLVKRSASILSEKSLELCTECLGSETGSDGFLSNLPSEHSDSNQEDKKQEHQEEKASYSPTLFDKCDDFPVVKFNCADRKKSLAHSFPPPLPSLSFNGTSDGASLKMQPRRHNGRLVLEAVSVPSQNNFHVQRQGGRLVIELVDNLSYGKASEKEDEENEIELEETFSESEENLSVFEEDGGEDFKTDEEEEDGEEEDEMEVKKDGKGNEVKKKEYATQNAPNLSRGMTYAHESSVMLSKPTYLLNKNPSKFNEVAKVKGKPNPSPIAQSLPPRPRPAELIPTPRGTVGAPAAASLNAYEYNWRRENPLAQEVSPFKESNRKFIVSKNLAANSEQQQLEVMKDLPLLNGCKEPRRSLLFPDPPCIATS